MIIGLDTDVLVHWLMQGAPRQARVQSRILAHLGNPGARFAIAPQCLNEFVHVVTDSKRFVSPLPMHEAIDLASQLWRAEEVVPVLPTVTAVARTWDLLAKHGLGRKRILDTSLAATLESAGIRELWTFNIKDYALFSFLTAVDPTK